MQWLLIHWFLTFLLLFFTSLQLCLNKYSYRFSIASNASGKHSPIRNTTFFLHRTYNLPPLWSSWTFSAVHVVCVSRCVWAQRRARMCWSAGQSTCAPRRSTRSLKPSLCCFAWAAFTKWERCSTGKKQYWCCCEPAVYIQTLRSVWEFGLCLRMKSCINSIHRNTCMQISNFTIYSLNLDSLSNSIL